MNRADVMDAASKADRQLKDRHRMMWALGNYPAVVADLIAPLGPVLVEAAGVRAGDEVLDVAAGSGNVAIPAARLGARVVASDLTPELLDAGRRVAAGEGVELDWETADAEALPYDDGRFDAVLSCVGVMFAPHHQQAADELVRVCRPGGTLGLISWTPAGFIGQLFATMKPYAPPPPAGVQPPPLWGAEDHVRRLLGDRVERLHAETRTLVVDHFDAPDSFRRYFASNYGPTIAVYRAIQQDPDRVAALDRDLDELFRRSCPDPAHPVLEWEYLLVTAQIARG